MSNLVSRLTNAAVGAAAVLALSSGATIVSTDSAQAQWGPRAGWGGPGYRGGYRGGYRPAYRYGYRGYRPNRGAAVAAGIIGGLAAGALIAGAARPAYAAPAYGYAPPAYGYVPSYHQPSYYQPAYEPYAPAYQPACYYRKIRQVVDYNTVVIRRVRVCD
jgi:hypothetical protein